VIRMTQWVVVLAAAGGLGCGGGDSTPAEQAPARQTPAPPRTEAKAPEEAPPGFCDLISNDEIAAAFGGKLPLDEPREVPEGCVVPVVLGDDEGNAVRFGALSQANYEGYKYYEDKPEATFERLEGLGREAFVINHNQLQILGKDGQPFMVALQLKLRGREMPLTPDEIQNGVVSLGRLLVDRR